MQDKRILESDGITINFLTGKIDRKTTNRHNPKDCSATVSEDFKIFLLKLFNTESEVKRVQSIVAKLLINDSVDILCRGGTHSGVYEFVRLLRRLPVKMFTPALPSYTCSDSQDSIINNESRRIHVIYIVPITAKYVDKPNVYSITFSNVIEDDQNYNTNDILRWAIDGAVEYFEPVRERRKLILLARECKESSFYKDNFALDTFKLMYDYI